MAKPKPKSPEEKQAALDQMLSMAATTNHMTGTGTAPAPVGPEGGQAVTPTSQPTPTKEEQKGENASVAPDAETRAPAAEAALASVTPVPAMAPEPEPTAAAELVPTPTPEPAPTPKPQVQAEPAPVAPVPKPETVLPVESSAQAIPESATTVEMGTVELASLFIPSADKKTFTMRLTDAHYQYLLLLGTIVGNGTSPPDIVHNILAHFIDRNDAQIQKSIAKQLRQRQSKK